MRYQIKTNRKECREYIKNNYLNKSIKELSNDLKIPVRRVYCVRKYMDLKKKCLCGCGNYTFSDYQYNSDYEIIFNLNGGVTNESKR